MGLSLHPATLPLAPALPASHDEPHQCTSVPATCSGAACNKSDQIVVVVCRPGVPGDGRPPRQRTLRATLLPSRARSRTRKAVGTAGPPCRLPGGCRRLLTPTPAGSCMHCLASWPPTLSRIGLPGLPSFLPCLSLFLPLSGYHAPVAPSAAAALCWLLFPCLVGRSFELLCPTAGCCWVRVAAPGRFLLV
jgi:hypothetical protein